MHVIAKDAAEQELQSIVDFWEVNPEGEDWENSRARLLAAIGKGRITLNAEKGIVTMGLTSPVELKNGDVITELDFHEPTGADLKIFDKYKENDKIAKSLHLASRMTGRELAVIERMGSRDISTMAAITSLFF
jgi:hypothetical protein